MVVVSHAESAEVGLRTTRRPDCSFNNLPGHSYGDVQNTLRLAKTVLLVRAGGCNWRSCLLTAQPFGSCPTLWRIQHQLAASNPVSRPAKYYKNIISACGVRFTMADASSDPHQSSAGRAAPQPAARDSSEPSTSRKPKECSWCKWMKAGGCGQEFEVRNGAQQHPSSRLTLLFPPATPNRVTDHFKYLFILEKKHFYELLTVFYVCEQWVCELPGHSDACHLRQQHLLPACRAGKSASMLFQKEEKKSK